MACRWSWGSVNPQKKPCAAKVTAGVVGLFRDVSGHPFVCFWDCQQDEGLEEKLEAMSQVEWPCTSKTGSNGNPPAIDFLPKFATTAWTFHNKHFDSAKKAADLPVLCEFPASECARSLHDTLHGSTWCGLVDPPCLFLSLGSPPGRTC